MTVCKPLKVSLLNTTDIERDQCLKKKKNRMMMMKILKQAKSNNFNRIISFAFSFSIPLYLFFSRHLLSNLFEFLFLRYCSDATSLPLHLLSLPTLQTWRTYSLTYICDVDIRKSMYVCWHVLTKFPNQVI